MRIAAVAVAYFLIVFAVGFVLGTVRVLWLVAVLGERWAELAELPVMVTASYFAARFVVARARLELRAAAAAGALALVLLLDAELIVVLALRGLTISEYLAGRDPVAGAAYAFALLVFAALPAWVARGVRSRSDPPR